MTMPVSITVVAQSLYIGVLLPLEPSYSPRSDLIGQNCCYISGAVFIHPGIYISDAVFIKSVAVFINLWLEFKYCDFETNGAPYY